MDTYEVEDQKRTALNLLQRKTTTEHCDVRILTWPPGNFETLSRPRTEAATAAAGAE